MVKKPNTVRSGAGWLEAARTLRERERGRLAWALGAAMERVLATATEAASAEVTVLEAIVAEAVGQLAGPQQVRQPARGRGALPGSRGSRGVTAHLPGGMREQAAQAMRAAWEIPEVARARSELSELAAAWRVNHPGAAARLRAEIEPTTITQALGVHGALAQRLRTVAPARYLLEHCLPAGSGRSGRDFAAAIALAARQRQDGFRRLSEHAALPKLVHALDA